MGLARFMLKLLALGTVLGIILFIIAYALVSIAYGLHIDFASGDIYKEVRVNNDTIIRYYRDHIEILEYVKPDLTEEQWRFAYHYWKDNRIYEIVDRQGRLWRVGQGHLPQPTWAKTIIRLERTLTLGELVHTSPGVVLAADADLPPPKCVYQTIGSKIPIFISGTIGGTQFTQVDWYIGYNKYFSEAVVIGEEIQYNWTYEDIAKNYTTEVMIFWTMQSFSYDCVVPRGVNVLELSFTENDTNFEYYLGPTLVADNMLPEAGNYTFMLWARVPVILDNGSIYYVTRVFYTDTSVHTGDAPPSNPIARAIWKVGTYIKRALSGIGRAIVNALQAVLPEPLKQLLSSVWTFFNIVFDVFTASVQYVASFSDYFKLLVYFIPIIVVAISIHDPFAVPHFFMWLFDLMRKVVSFIRSLLPV